MNTHRFIKPFQGHARIYRTICYLLAIAASICLPNAFSLVAGNYTWTNTAGTGNWNSSDANWNGVLWVNSTTSHPIFNNFTGSITLTEPITAGSLNAAFGGRQSGIHDLILTGSQPLSLTGLTVNGLVLGGNCDNITEASQQRLTLNNTSVTVDGNVIVSRGSLLVKGNTVVNISGSLSGPEAWGLFTIQDNATVLATAGLNYTHIANGVHLNGGSLSTAYIHVGNAMWDGLSGLRLNGGTIVALQDNSDFLQVYNNGNTIDRAAVTLDSGGVILDSGGYAITIASTIQGPGKLTKIGNGTLTLNSVNTYSGGTQVNAGKLVLATGVAAGTGRIGGVLTVNTGATVETTGDGTGLGWFDQISTIVLDGGTLTSPGTCHIWNITGGISMIGGTLQSNSGSMDPNGPQLEWNRTTVTTQASPLPSTIAGRIRMRNDGSDTGITFHVGDGLASSDLLVSAAITEAASGMGITKYGAGTLTLSATNSYTGNTIINGGSLILHENSRTLFRPTSNQTCNLISGSSNNLVSLRGEIYLDLVSADNTPGNSWTLVDTNTLNVQYGSQFAVTSSLGDFTNTSGVWTLDDGAIIWVFNQSSGVLSATRPSFADWIDTSWPDLQDKTFDGDPDHDDIPNILEYVLFDGDPLSASSAILPDSDVSESHFIFSFHRRRSSLSDTTQVFQFGSDLTTWTNVPLHLGGMVSITADSPTIGIDEIVISVPKDNHQKLFGRIKVAHFDMSRLNIGQPEVIYTDAQMPYTMDASWAPIKENDGSMTLFETAMGLIPYYFRHSGVPDNPLQLALAPYVFDYNGYNATWPSGCWIPNIYRHDDGTLVGFVHREDLYPANGHPTGGNNFFIGLAKSTNGGLNWTYLGDVLATRGNGSTTQGFANIGGVPYLIIDGYVHLYYNEHDGPLASDFRFLSVARAKLVDIMSAVANGQVPQFHKYNQGTWTEDGLTGLGGEVIGQSRCRNDWSAAYDFHSDATYCRPLGRYLITVQTHAANLLKLYSSADGIDWRFEKNLDYAPGCMLPYSSFIGFGNDSTADSREVGSEFYIYYTRKVLANYDHDTLCRIKCTIIP